MIREFLPFIAVGVVTGAIYALASMGLVLTYTTSGVFNFAHGAVGMFATYLFYSLRVDVGVPTPVAIGVAVLLIAPAMGIVIDRGLLRRLEGAPPATYVVTSLGLLVALQGLAVALYGSSTRQVAPIFPTRTVQLPGVSVGLDQAVVVVLAIVAGVGLAFFFRGTHLGLQTRAVVGDRELTELVGTNSQFVTTFSWMLGCAFAALSGILFSPFIQLDSLLLTLLVVQAFGAAIIGRLRSLPLTNLGAYAIGILAALATKFAATRPGLAGVPSALPFIALFLFLVASPKSWFAESKPSSVLRGVRRRPSGTGVSLPAVLVTVTVAVALPGALSGSRLLTATTALIFILLFSSLSLLVGLSRQVSLCHAVFVVFGATTLSHLLAADVPYFLALLLAGLAMVPVGALLALPTIRLSGLFLALATFGFGILAQALLFPTSIAFGQDGTAAVARPSLFRSGIGFYYFVLVVVTVAVALVHLVQTTRLGRILRAMGDSPIAAESLGVSPVASRVIVFCLSAFLAALTGGLLGSLVQLVTPSSFDAFQSLIWLTVLVTAGVQTLSGSVLASVLFIVVPTVFTSPEVVKWQPVFFGVAAILLAQTPNGLAGIFFRSPNFALLAERSRARRGHGRTADRYVGALLARAIRGEAR